MILMMMMMMMIMMISSYQPIDDPKKDLITKLTLSPKNITIIIITIKMKRLGATQSIFISP